MKTPASPLPAPPRLPAKKRANRRKRLNPWLQLAVLACVGMFGAWAIFQIAIKVIHPYRLGFDEARRVAELREKLAKQTARNNELSKQVAYLHSSEGAECEARRLGYHRPGEVVYLLDQTAIEQTSAGTP